MLAALPTRKMGPEDYDDEGHLITCPGPSPNSFHTSEMARACKANAAFRCQTCGHGDRPLQSHHRDYDNYGKEIPSDLVCLCDVCHAAVHARRKADKLAKREGIKVSVEPEAQVGNRFRPERK